MLTLTTVQRCKLSVAAVDAHGNPAQVDDVQFESSDPAVLAITPTSPADPLSAWVNAVGATGHAQVTVKADADLGEGVVPLQGILEVEVLAAQAVSLGITTGTPEEAPVVNPLPKKK